MTDSNKISSKEAKEMLCATILLEALRDAFEMLTRQQKDELLDTYPDTLAECCWCREGGETPALHLESEMSGYRDDELGGRLCKSCAEVAAQEASEY